MALSIQDYVIRLRAISQQVNARSTPDGHVPVVSTQEWADVLNYAFEVVPGLEPHWREIGAWVADMMALFDAYHVLAREFLAEDETEKLPVAPLAGERQGLLSSHGKYMLTDSTE